MIQSKTTADAMYPLVESYLAGQQTQNAFCHEHGMSVAKLNYWLAKYRQEAADESAPFVEITPGRAPADGVLMEVVYPHGVRLRLFAPVEPAYLARLLTPALLGT